MSTGKPGEDLQQADIEWREGIPVCRRFEDVYYSRENGLAESRHVFLAGNGLPDRWGTLSEGDAFHIVETGFGTGLNFLAAARLWLDCAPATTTLHYVSVEKYPLDRDTLARALDSWPELRDLAGELLANYPPAVAGVHRRWLMANRVCLTLVFDDAAAGLAGLRASDHPEFRHSGPRFADAWFLDGFAPARNPDLWRPDLFDTMACLSHDQTTVATFTVARTVREGLAAAGFEIAKRPGHGRKRDMLTGRFRPSPADRPAERETASGRRFLRQSGHQPPWYLADSTPPTGNTVAVIGAGIAGCATAAALARRGYSVTLVDRHGQPGMEASGNPQGILYPRLSVEDSDLALFGRHALCHAMAYYREYWQAGFPGQACGVVVVPESDRDLRHFERIGTRFRAAPDLVRLLEGTDLAERAGIALAATRGLFFPAMGWVTPPQVCRWLCGTLPVIAAEVDTLYRDSASGRWLLRDHQGEAIATAHHVVLANSHLAKRFPATADLPLRPVRGQISSVPATPRSTSLQTVVCGQGYVAPHCDGFHTLGATYGVDDRDTAVRAEDHLSNLASLAATDSRLGELFDAHRADATGLGGRAAVRCTTPDYLPVVGAVADAGAMALRFADLARNARADIPLPGRYLDGLWINVGHGSRGLTYAPLAAELLAAQIAGEPPPLSRPLVLALHPARFIIRAIKRQSGKSP